MQGFVSHLFVSLVEISILANTKNFYHLHYIDALENAEKFPSDSIRGQNSVYISTVYMD